LTSLDRLKAKGFVSTKVFCFCSLLLTGVAIGLLEAILDAPETVGLEAAIGLEEAILDAPETVGLKEVTLDTPETVGLEEATLDDLF